MNECVACGGRLYFQEIVGVKTDGEIMQKCVPCPCVRLAAVIAAADAMENNLLKKWGECTAIDAYRTAKGTQ